VQYEYYPGVIMTDDQNFKSFIAFSLIMRIMECELMAVTFRFRDTTTALKSLAFITTRFQLTHVLV
jgi:hypothetical protein